MIFRLPYFAQISVIQYLEPHECFFLGFLSKKSKRLVQRSMKKTVNATVIDLNFNKIEVSNNSSKNNEDGKQIVMWKKYNKRGKDTKNDGKKITLEYNGSEMECRLTFDKLYDLPVVWCDPRHMKLVPLALQKAISDVFDISNVIQIRMGLSSGRFSDFPAITQVDHIYDSFYTREVKEKLLDRFLKRVKVKHSLSILNSMRFDPNSPIFLVDHLCINEARKLPRESFLNFTGKSAIFRNTDLQSKDLIDFVRKWLKGTNTNLEAMVVVRNNLIWFDRRKVLEQFDTMPWDPKRRDGRFKYPENTQTLYHSTDLLDCTKQVDIERKHDGLLATIVVRNEEFCFFVWHTPFAPPGTNLPVTVIDDRDQSVSYPLGTIAF